VQQLPSARNNRHQHFENLNEYNKFCFPAEQMLGRFWMIDRDIFDEFLEMLPPAYCVGGFRMIEMLTGDIAATYVKIGDHYWCGYTSFKKTTPHTLIKHIEEECSNEAHLQH
jgi:hypothetical protein